MLTMIRTALYACYSTDKQREASVEDQARNCRRVAEREGWQLGKTYQDQAVSGSRADRAGYQSMLANARAGQFDVLLVDDISRLSRDRPETATGLAGHGRGRSCPVTRGGTAGAVRRERPVWAAPQNPPRHN